MKFCGLQMNPFSKKRRQHDETGLDNFSAKESNQTTVVATLASRLIKSEKNNHDCSEESALVNQRQQFLMDYPDYKSSFLDELRLKEFQRLDASSSYSVYLDYTGSGLYAASHLGHFVDALSRNVYGNPHSTNPTSMLSTKVTHDAKIALLEFVDADPTVYDVIWTQNATSAIKIIAEGFPYANGQRLVVSSDCHNSVNGMRAFARSQGIDVVYSVLPDDGHGLQPNAVEKQLGELQTEGTIDTDSGSGLFVVTAQSNITGLKAPLKELTQVAKRLGYTTLIDAAALLPTTSLSLKSLNNTIDAVALSMYKMIGFPTGVGALIIKKQVLETLRKPWFSGGTVQLVQAPGEAFTMEKGAARLEDGTQDFLSMIPIPRSLALLKETLPHLEKRLPTLVHWTIQQMSKLLHEGTHKRVVLVRSPKLELDVHELGKLHGALIAFEVKDKRGEYVNCEVIEYAASKQFISLRAGCMCNPGGAASIMGMQTMMAQLQPGETKTDIKERFGVRAVGLTRASFGIASNFNDAYTLIQFLTSFTQPHALENAKEAFYSRERVTSAC